MERSLRARRAKGATRPFGIRLSGLAELAEVVRLTCTLDEQARQAGVNRIDDDTFLVTFNLRPERIPTVAAAVRSLGTVVEGSEMDPD